MKKIHINEFLLGKILPNIAYVYTSNQNDCMPSALLTKPVKKRPLVITFAALIRRDRKQVPAFVGQSLLESVVPDATILAFSDPSLELSSDLSVGWYAGNHQQDIPSDIKQIVEIFIEELEPSRLIFVGGSAGSHPAAAISHAFKNSLVIVVNPVLNLESALDSSSPGYFAIENYMKWCWPDLEDPQALAEVILIDTTKLYQDGYENMLIILSNATDMAPIQKQYMDFYMRVPNTDNILYMSNFFPESLGHRYPKPAWGQWVHAAIAAPLFDLTSIAAEATPSLQISSDATNLHKEGWSSTDIDLADKLSKIHLEE